MGILADIFISRDEEAVGYDSNPNLPPSDRMEAKRITPLELSTLWAITSGKRWDISFMKEFKCIFEKDSGERLIHRVPAAMVQDLMNLAPGRIQTVASVWANTEEMNWPVDNACNFIEEVVSLAQRASESGRNVYVWNCV
ncbi:MAG TPA: hypothetical protein VJA94_19715 [Candidatus Angelobacter sp.]